MLKCFMCDDVIFAGPQRAGMASCYHRPCDSVRAPYDGSFVTDFEFFRQTVQALLNTVLELSR